MADSEFERFKKMFPRGKKDMNIMAIPAPLPGPGGIARAVVGRGVQSGIRRFSDVGKGDKTTKMKTRQGTERRDPMEPRVVESGRSEALRKAREGGGGVTKMKDRRGLEIKKPESKREVPPSRGPRPAPTSVAQKSSYFMTNPTQRAYDEKTSPKADVGTRSLTVNPYKASPPKPKPRPAKAAPKKVEKRKPEKKSKIRIAFEKEFAAARKAGKKKFASKLGKYGTYSTKLK